MSEILSAIFRIVVGVVDVVLVAYWGSLIYFSVRYDLFPRRVEISDEENTRNLAIIEDDARSNNKRLGIIGDGVADDTEALQRALDGQTWQARSIYSIRVRVSAPLRVRKPNSTVSGCMFLHPVGVEPVIVEPRGVPYYVAGNIGQDDAGVARVLPEFISDDIHMAARDRHKAYMWWLGILSPARVWIIGKWWRIQALLPEA